MNIFKLIKKGVLLRFNDAINEIKSIDFTNETYELDNGTTLHFKHFEQMLEANVVSFLSLYEIYDIWLKKFHNFDLKKIEKEIQKEIQKLENKESLTFHCFSIMKVGEVKRSSQYSLPDFVPPERITIQFYRYRKGNSIIEFVFLQKFNKKTFSYFEFQLFLKKSNPYFSDL